MKINSIWYKFTFNSLKKGHINPFYTGIHSADTTWKSETDW